MQHPLTTTHNPSAMLSLGILPAAIALLIGVINRRQLSWGLVLILGILFGVLSQIKVYAGIIGLGVLVTGTIIAPAVIRKKLSVSVFIGGIITYLTFFINNVGSNGLTIAPLLVYYHFMEQYELSWLYWPQKLAVFQADHNYLRIIVHYLFAIGFFIALHIGNRILIIAALVPFVNHKGWKKVSFWIIAAVFGICILFSTFFIQTTSIFDIVQFLWMGSIFSAIPAGYGLGYLWGKKLLVKVACIIIVAAPFLAMYVQEFNKYVLAAPQKIIAHEDLSVIKHIQESTFPDETVVVLPPRNQNGDLQFSVQPVIAGLSGRSIWYERELTPFADTEDSRTRPIFLKQLSDAIKACDAEKMRETLSSTGSKLILSYERITCDALRRQFSDNREGKEFFLYTLI